MQFYRYFKGHEKAGVWKPIPVEREQDAFDRPSYGFYTILAVSESVGSGVAITPNALYKGPFYVDIDSDDIKKSIKAVKRVVEQLRKNRIETLNVWASGKKGFHITVPMDVFTEDEALPKLPFVYRAMAASMKILDIECVDTSVYSSGKGRMWRIWNRERVDNQKYKVAITLPEIEQMNPEVYADLCSKARPQIPILDTGPRASTLGAFFTLAIARAAEMRRPKSTLIDQNLKDALGEDRVPPCVSNLTDGENFKDDVGFNQRSIQMNKALRAFVPDAEQDAFIERFVHSNQGESHNTPESRREHLNRGRRTVQTSSDYEWSCRSILSILGKPPCASCNICWIKDEQDDAEEAEENVSLRDLARQMINKDREEKGLAPVAASGPVTIDGNGGDQDEPPAEGEDPKGPRKKREPSGRPTEVTDTLEGLTITDDGYGFVTGEGSIRRVSNFVLRFTKVYYEYIANLDEERRVATAAEVYVGNRKVGTINMEDNAWQSKASFIGQFQGLSNCAFYGKDDDTQRMKSSLMADIDKTTTKIRRVHSCGIHHLRVGDTDVFTYVEPGWSIDNFGNVDSYSLSGQMPAAPRLKSVAMLNPDGDEMTTTMFKNLFQINSPENVSRILGWVMATFLKQHIFSYKNEFPLLCVWGKAGAGKTATSGMFSSLTGTEYLSGGSAEKQHSPLSLGGEASSNFALWSYISSSMSIPRLVEEYNKKNLKQKYEVFSEYFKEVWNQHSVKRGTIRNQKHHGTGVIDASIVDIPMTGPTLLISEQSIEVPALKHRTVEVQLYDEQRTSPETRRAWGMVSPRWRNFQRFAKTAHMEALHITVEQIQQWIEKYNDVMPEAIGVRPHYSFCVLGMGLEFLQFISDKYNLKLTREIEKLKHDLIEYASVNAHDIASEKQRTEVDLVMIEIATMVHISKEERMAQWLTKAHYRRTGNILLLDGIVAHSQYCRYITSSHKTVAIEQYNSFRQLIRAEDYCESSEFIDPNGFGNGRKLLRLNLTKLAHRGVDVAAFEEGG